MDFDDADEFVTPTKYPSIHLTHPLTPKKINGSELENDLDNLNGLKTNLFYDDSDDSNIFKTPQKSDMRPSNIPSNIPNAPIKSKKNVNTDLLLESIGDIDNQFNKVNRNLIFA